MKLKRILAAATAVMMLTSTAAMAASSASYNDGKVTVTTDTPQNAISRIQITGFNPDGSDFYTDFANAQTEATTFEIPVAQNAMQGKYTFKVSETGQVGLIKQNVIEYQHGTQTGCNVEYFKYKNNFKKVESTYTGSITAEAKVSNYDTISPMLMIAIYKQTVSTIDGSETVRFVDAFTNATVGNGVLNLNIGELNYSVEGEEGVSYFAKVMLWDKTSVTPVTWAFDLK